MAVIKTKHLSYHRFLVLKYILIIHDILSFFRVQSGKEALGVEQKREIERLSDVLQTEDSQYQDDYLAAQQKFLDTEVCVKIIYILYFSSITKMCFSYIYDHIYSFMCVSMHLLHNCRPLFKISCHT